MQSSPATPDAEHHGFSVRFWGVRGSIPSPEPEHSGYGGNTACVEVRCDDQLIILDAGSGIRRLGRELAAQYGTTPIDATLLISHTHWDHIQGLPFFQAAYSASNCIRILGGPGTASRLQNAFRNQMSPMHFPVPLSHLGALEPVGELPSDDTMLGHVRVRTTALNHPGGCAGFRLEAGGSSVAYLPDHEAYLSRFAAAKDASAAAADAALVNFLRGTDLLILDSQYDRGEYPSRVGWGHSCVDDSVDLAIRAEVRTLALFHHDPEHDDAKINTMVAHARRLVANCGATLQVRAAREQEQIVLREKQRLAA